MTEQLSSAMPTGHPFAGGELGLTWGVWEIASTQETGLDGQRVGGEVKGHGAERKPDWALSPNLGQDPPPPERERVWT